MEGIYIGNQHAAANPALLASLNITAVLNVAWDLDIRYDESQYVDTQPDPSNERLIFQYAKVGLVDGDGNSQAVMAAALYTLQQFLSPRVKLSPDEAAKYPEPVQNVLVHCHSGTSRSVTVGALYLFFATDMFDSYADALAFVKEKRHLTSDLSAPKPQLTALATKLAAQPILDWFPLTGQKHSPNAPPSPVAPSRAGPASKSMSSGMVTLVVFAVAGGLFSLYCIIGIFYNRFVRGMDGVNVLPHPRIWGRCFQSDPYGGAIRLPSYDFN